MELIFFEKVCNFGNFGDKVNVKLGYGCNYLLLQGKVVCVNVVNFEVFEKCCVEYEVKVNMLLVDVEFCKVQLVDVLVMIIVYVSLEGKLYGLVGLCDIVEVFEVVGKIIYKGEVIQGEGLICYIGEFDVVISLYVDVQIIVKVIVVGEK